MMSLPENIVVIGGFALLGAGGLISFGILQWRARRREAREAIEGRETIEAARREAETLLRESRLAANEEVFKLREQAEKAFAARRLEFDSSEQRLSEREKLINHQLAGLVEQEKTLRSRLAHLALKEDALEKDREEARTLARQRRDQIQQIAQLDEAEARAALLQEIEADCQKDAVKLSRHILESARATAQVEAQRIICLAIQRYAGRHSFENTTATVALPGDEIKGRIIGREGRNIRAFEAATGITVLIDDTPNAVVLSGFDPVRREVAREAMQRLIQDGRIHPTRIEEVVAQVTSEIDQTILKAGEEALFKLGLPPMHLDVVRLLGRLRFRTSFTQNLLDHSIEVAHLTGLLAAELGVNVTAAKRAGLLHDIGKALNHEIEGSHALIGADFVRRHGEADDVVNGVASHHDEVPHSGVLGILVSAADAISAARPGARSETMTTYIRRVENLEQLGASFPGVEKCFAIQAGRELRVLVQPDRINDEQAYLLAKSIVRKIEEELQYPGQIRVTVVRETRCIELAK